MPRIDWSKADWSKSNMQIALTMGICSANRVAYMRKQLKAPPAPPHKRWIPYVNRTKKAA